MSRARASERTVTQIRTVQVIPPTTQAQGDCPNQSVRPKRVAAYARVSTSSEEQLTSYEAQVAHYTSYIKSREATDNWQFVEVYTDKGISGVSTKKREGFNRMIEDALSGKIDLIITKSVSRFARNTVDTLTTIRKLKERGVEVYFEKEDINAICREALHSVLKPAPSGRAGAEDNFMPDDRKKRDRSRIEDVLDEDVPFTPSLFVALVDRVVIERDGRMMFVFRNGEEHAYFTHAG